MSVDSGDATKANDLQRKAERDGRSSFLTEGLLLAALSATAYLVAFLYERGYCDHFGIPTLLIAPSTSNILAAAVAVSVGFLGTIPFLGSFTSIVRDVRSSERLKPYRSIILTNILLAMAAIIGATLYGVSWTLVSVLFTIFILINITNFGPPAMRYRQYKTWRERFLATEEAEMRSGGSIDLLLDSLGPRMMKVVLVVIVLLFASYIVGNANANRQKDFFVLNDPPNYVVLRSYGDTLVTSKLDRAAKQTGSEFLFLRISNIERLKLTAERIGPLQAPKPRE